MTKNNRFSPAKIKFCPKGLHHFAFYILIFAFSFQSLTPNVIVSKYLRLYICRETFTHVMSALQIDLFMQNKAKFQKVKLSVTIEMKKDYEQLDTWSIRKNEPKTNPNEPKTNPILANKTPERTQFKPKQTQFKPNLSCRSPLAKQEQNQFRPNMHQFLLACGKVNFQPQNIDGSAQIGKISDNVCFVYKGLYF
ncbi:MAG: hypothetical protein GWN67_17375 [Phycisphaerae bacterium]|nr:hypothetical protein [Phycisphaerae bacterium]NIW68543.1 hypothetical protein [candidate division KSB1 bacterium]NIS53822.1 hypothetical protein [Phycisphaerae bacterium]NIU11412.1 hypothetical protein [Phycisphaerae bacterium]NIU58092.1 hypothetical protein [Phycisphaerae bacterium]